jgi:hypothetical protein
MTKWFFFILMILGQSVIAQPVVESKRLAMINLRDMQSTVAVILANQFGIRDKEVAQVLASEIIDTWSEFIASEYDKNLTQEEIKAILKILSSSSGQIYLKTSNEVMRKVVQDPEFTRPLFRAACARSKSKFTAQQTNLIESSVLCK